jgi:hypothetical protein
MKLSSDGICYEIMHYVTHTDESIAPLCFAYCSAATAPGMIHDAASQQTYVLFWRHHLLIPSVYFRSREMLLYSEAWDSGCMESFYLVNWILGHVCFSCCLSTGIVIGGGWKGGVGMKGCLVHEKGNRNTLLNHVLYKWRRRRCHWDTAVSNSVHFVEV